MTNMVRLASQTGSKVVIVACPQCGRISRQILREEYQIKPLVDLRAEHICPICGTSYRSLSSAKSPSWTSAYQHYIAQGEQAYNETIKTTYQLSLEEQTEATYEKLNDMPIPTKQPQNETTPTFNSDSTNSASLLHVESTVMPQEASIEQPIENTTIVGAVPIPKVHSIVQSKHSNPAMMKKKVTYWKSQLLDTSKRNKMINFKSSKHTTLKILVPQFTELFNRLAINEESLLFQRPIDKSSDSRTFAMLSLLETLSYPIPAYIGNIRAEGSLLDCKNTLSNLRSKSKLARDEQGTNILYLMFGFIEWRENNSPKTPWIKSPVLMMPVSIKLETFQAPYCLSRYDDDIEVNPTLEYLFHKEYNIDLPTFELVGAESISKYMDDIEALTNHHGWKLIRDVHVGLLSFLKISMFHDLNNNQNRMLQNPVIRAMTGDQSIVNAIPKEFESLDTDRISPYDCYQVVHSDSSQQKAILLSKAGVSFVMQGPPGTGKSQTITNIIAEALGDGRKVLFVSEKAAALQVVYNRLCEVELDVFCLPLHSHKANKNDILASIAANMDLPRKRIKQSALFELDSLFYDKQMLNQYVKELHEEILPLGKTLYEMFSELSTLQNNIYISFSIENIEKISGPQFHAMLHRVTSYENALKAFGIKFSENPWRNTIIKTVTQNFRDKFMRELYGLQDALQTLDITIHNAKKTLQFQEPCSWTTAMSILELLTAMEVLPLFPATWFDDSNSKKLYKKATQSKLQQQQYNQYYNTVMNHFQESILSEDLSAWLTLTRICINDITKISEKFPVGESEILSSAAGYFRYADALDTELAVIDTLYKEGLSIFPLKVGDTLHSISLFVNTAKQFLSIASFIHAEQFDLFDMGTCSFAEVTAQTETELQQYNERLTTVSEIFHPSVFDENLSEWLRITKESISTFQQMESLRIPNDSTIAASAEKYHVLVQKCISELKSFLGAYDKGSSILSLQVGTSFEDIAFFGKTVKKLLDSPIMIEIWFSPSMNAKIHQLLDEAKIHASILEEKNAVVLENWEKSAFRIDAEEILNRFKTEYISVLKVFKSSYYADMKLLRSVAKKVGARIHHKKTIAFLQNLCEIKEENQWFSSNEQLLSDYFGCFYLGAKSDWMQIEACLAFIENLQTLFPRGMIPYSVSELICGKDSRMDDYNALKEISLILNEKVAAHIKLTLDPIVEDCNTKNVRNTLLPLLEKLEKISDRLLTQNSIIMPHVKANVQYEELLEGVESAVELMDNKNHITKIYIKDLSSMYPNKLISEKDVSILQQLISNASQCQSLAEIVKKITPEMLAQVTEELSQAFVDSQTKALSQSLIPCITHLKNKSEQLLKQIEIIERHTKRTVPKENLLTVVSDAEKIVVFQNTTASKTEVYTSLFGEHFQGLKTDWSSIVRYLEMISALSSMSTFKMIPESFLLSFSNNMEFRKEVFSLLDLLKSQCAEIDRPLHLFSGLFSEESKIENAELSDVSTHVSACMENLLLLDNWLICTEAKKECDDLGLSDFTLKIQQQDNTLDDLVSIFKYGFYSLWLQAVMETKKTVKQFRRHSHDDQIQQFVSLDNRQLVFAKERIKQNVIANIPDGNRVVTANDEVSILQKEFNKKRRIMPLRKLFRSIPNLLLRLKPCMMMSPLSVAYFLDADSYEFDMVIFDESSQVFPEDAIGSIIRAKQVIIAGDSKQLPPSNFFKSSINNDESDYDVEDENDFEVSDSILEETISALPSSTLLWHYRSKHESLISFSNQEIYQNQLITFPSQTTCQPDLGVEFVYVEDGIYEGKGRNTCEAKHCVTLVKEHIETHPERSLGIIAFSENQQKIIAYEIQNFREQNPAYESFFEEDKENEFFVKNLENVQGDERDTIIFSISYAKTLEQRENNRTMSLRFGPLGQKGGERRLNVAITRAKCNIKLVSSILPSDIDLERTDSKGIHLLCSYIGFAMNRTLPSSMNAVAHEHDLFVDVVAEYLTIHGYHVEKYIGCSEYKIDIAIVHPQNKNSFVAGIECDGFSYATAKSAHDRDHLRKSVLENMGWTIHRVWSPEWIARQEIESEKLLIFVRNALKDFSEVPIRDTITQKDSNNSSDEFVEDVESKIPTDASAFAAKSENPYGFAEYIEADWHNAPNSSSAIKDIHIPAIIKYVVHIEQPIHIDLLYQRMASALEKQRVTSLVREKIDSAIQSVWLRQVILKDSDGFLSLTGGSQLQVRIPSSGSLPRSIRHIAPSELGLAMMTIVSQSIGLTVDGLLEATSKALGYTRKSEHITACLKNAFEQLIKNDQIKVVDDKIRMIGEENSGQ